MISSRGNLNGMAPPWNREAEALIERIRSALAHEHGLRVAVGFGSTGRGTAGAGSDIDVGILPSVSMKLGDELGLEGRLEATLGRPVDVVRIDLADPALRWRIARDGIVVLANPPHEGSRFLARAASEHDELAPLFEDAARRYAASVKRAAGGSP